MMTEHQGKSCEVNFKNTKEQISIELVFKKRDSDVDIRDFFGKAMKNISDLQVSFKKGQYELTEKDKDSRYSGKKDVLHMVPEVLRIFQEFYDGSFGGNACTGESSDASKSGGFSEQMMKNVDMSTSEEYPGDSECKGKKPNDNNQGRSEEDEDGTASGGHDLEDAGNEARTRKSDIKKTRTTQRSNQPNTSNEVKINHSDTANNIRLPENYREHDEGVKNISVPYEKQKENYEKQELQKQKPTESEEQKHYTGGENIGEDQTQKHEKDAKEHQKSNDDEEHQHSEDGNQKPKHHENKELQHNEDGNQNPNHDENKEQKHSIDENKKQKHDENKELQHNEDVNHKLKRNEDKEQTQKSAVQDLNLYDTSQKKCNTNDAGAKDEKAVSSKKMQTCYKRDDEYV